MKRKTMTSIGACNERVSRRKVNHAKVESESLSENTIVPVKRSHHKRKASSKDEQNNNNNNNEKHVKCNDINTKHLRNNNNDVKTPADVKHGDVKENLNLHMDLNAKQPPKKRQSHSQVLPENYASKRPKLDSKIDMFRHYQPWVIKTYGDLSKTKTVTLRKYARILRALRGEELNSVDSSKFRFWVKSKGFHIGKPSGYDPKPADAIIGRFTIDDIAKEDLLIGAGDNEKSCGDIVDEDIFNENRTHNSDPALYVPTAPVKNVMLLEPVYRKVAIVENFFDIIYSVHVELEGRPGKHAGQKRTYRTITETYAFLPREAVTRFLLGCTDCQKRPRSPSPLHAVSLLPTPSPSPTLPSQHTQSYSQNNSKKIPQKQNEPDAKLTNCTEAKENNVETTKTPTPTQTLSADEKSRNNNTAFPTNFPTPTTPKNVQNNFSSIADLSKSVVKSNDSSIDLNQKPLITSTSFTDYQNPSFKKEKVDVSEQPITSTPTKKLFNPLDVCNLTSKDPPRSKKRYLGPLRLAQDIPTDSNPASINGINSINQSRHEFRMMESTIDYNLPITTTYLKHMRSLGYTDEDALKFERYENMSTPEPTDVSEEDPYAGSLMKDGDKLKLMLLAWNYHNQATQGRNNGVENSGVNAGGGLLPDLPQLPGVNPEDMAGLWASYHNALGLGKGGLLKPSSTPPAPTHRESSSPVMVETGSAHDETSSSGNKEDEDDEDDESDERIDTHSHHDPERLKAFNMFVRLFVDENLDRMVPISKQPKEKIQAIIDSCTRQFPEFAERARKRIRTYLKSCRRNKRARDPSAPWDATRPTPAHLTSVQAEQILATACENESMNAKRMRMGMEPVSQPMPILPGATTTDTTVTVGANVVNRGLDFATSTTASITKMDTTESSPFTSGSTTSTSISKTVGNATGIMPLVSENKSQPLGLTANNLATSSVATMNGLAAVVGTTMAGANSAGAGAAPTAMYRPNFSQAFQRAGSGGGAYPNSNALFPSPNTQAFNLAAAAAVTQTTGLLSNGPTDLSMKQGPQPQKPLLTHKLSGGEMTAVRQLITGYRESAAFLLRSADELEQLLLQQQQQQ